MALRHQRTTRSKAADKVRGFSTRSQGQPKKIGIGRFAKLNRMPYAHPSKPHATLTFNQRQTACHYHQYTYPKPHAITHTGTRPSKPHAISQVHSIAHVHSAEHTNRTARVEVTISSRSCWLIICFSKVRTNSLYSYQILNWCIPTSHVKIQRFHDICTVMGMQTASRMLHMTRSPERCLVSLVEIVGCCW